LTSAQISGSPWITSQQSLPPGAETEARKSIDRHAHIPAFKTGGLIQNHAGAARATIKPARRSMDSVILSIGRNPN
jgi:hypothetical protein